MITPSALSRILLGGEHVRQRFTSLRAQDGVGHFFVVAVVVEEAELDEEAGLKGHDGEGLVLALRLGLDATVLCAQGQAHGVVEPGGERGVFLAAKKRLGSAGAGIGGVAVQGDHDVRLIMTGDPRAAAHGAWVGVVNAGADDMHAAGDEVGTQLVGPGHDDTGLGDGDAVMRDGGARAVIVTPAGTLMSDRCSVTPTSTSAKSTSMNSGRFCGNTVIASSLIW